MTDEQTYPQWQPYLTNMLYQSKTDKYDTYE